MLMCSGSLATCSSKQFAEKVVFVHCYIVALWSTFWKRCVLVGGGEVRGRGRRKTKVLSAKNRELSQVLSVKPEICQNIAWHDSPAARNSAFQNPTFRFSQPFSFFFFFKPSSHVKGLYQKGGSGRENNFYLRYDELIFCPMTRL